ncbi:hypothetical protein L211DRAFT_32788 [Terfezia boudieri ATCC MYA-4762]|uniref:Kelch repeat protein n=1 Tax=Terfezia boudieri ATCC MYA-4762 TaxID=1051890 RepID=A0A3N4M3T6_9PEZI|nr:hypothetical protein L211DRAFT_32788 [Terfezia boudieri ATCC MYA-4762]
MDKARLYGIQSRRLAIYDLGGGLLWGTKYKHLWELDLSAKFNTSKPPWTANPKPDDWNKHYNGAQGTLWNLGDGKFYTLGGWMSNIYQGPPGGYRIVDPYYTPVKSSDGTTTYTYQLPPTRIQSKRNKVGYTLGGFPVVEKQDGGTDKNFIAQVVDTGTWQTTLSAYDFRTNKFNASELPDEIGATNNVVLYSLDRVGDEGVLIALAGKSKNNNLEAYRPMDEMWLYDIATSQWMQQKATGDIPSVRTRSCSVLVPAPDLSSYQIYMFSGATTGDVRILDMYVLSVPAFIWTKIDLKNYSNQWGIGDMACALYEDRQFIIVPGEVNVSTSANENDTWFLECNMGTAVHVFDTYDWTFKDEFNPDNKGSKVPSAIVNLIGGDEKGNALLQQPKAGWDNKALGSIFQTRNQLPPDESTNSVTNVTATNSQPHQTGSNDGQNMNGENTNEPQSNIGPIVGGVVGGLAGLGLLLGLFFWWRKRQGVSTQGTQPAIPELGGNGYSGAPRYYDAPRGPYMPPQELQAYEPQEIGGTGYYAPAKLVPEQGHPEGVDINNPSHLSVHPITPELQQQQIQRLGVDDHQGSIQTDTRPLDEQLRRPEAAKLQ